MAKLPSPFPAKFPREVKAATRETTPADVVSDINVPPALRQAAQDVPTVAPSAAPPPPLTPLPQGTAPLPPVAAAPRAFDPLDPTTWQGVSGVAAAIDSPSAKQKDKARNKARETDVALRNLHWPDITDADLWLLNDRKRGGFAQVPRILSLVMSVISDVAKRKTGKAIPAGKTYLVLWLRVFSEALVKIENEADVAFEAGYGGERNVTTFRAHMNLLQELGFIDFKRGSKGPYHYVLLLNPYQVFKKLHGEKLVNDIQYAALMERAAAIGSMAELEE